MQVLAFSSSRVGGGGFLEEAKKYIQEFLGDKDLKIAFVPFASVQRDYEVYGNMVKEALGALPYNITTVMPEGGREVIEESDVIMVGGGNTFKLLHDIYAYGLFDLIRDKVQQGTRYIGWSAGSNLTGATICTTNDMPIIQPQSFTAFGFFPFQLNPHYINIVQKDFHGETRDMRLEEFVLLNDKVPVVGLPEGTALMLDGDEIIYKGKVEGVVFRNEGGVCVKGAVQPGNVLSFEF